MKTKRALHILLVLLALYVASVTAMVMWPVLYLFRGKEVIRSATQALNAALGGLARESFSSRMGRTGEYAKVAAWIDSLLPEHTIDAARREGAIVSQLVPREKL